MDNTNNTIEKLEVLLENEKSAIVKLALSIIELKDENAKLDSMLNKTIDAHEVTKQRLLGYENEAGVPKSESERDAYTSYNPK